VPNIFLTNEAVIEHRHPNCHAVRDLQQYLAAAAVVGDVVIESGLDSWQTYFYWLDDAKAPTFARLTVARSNKWRLDMCEKG
jgi:hypothetical protein